MKIIKLTTDNEEVVYANMDLVTFFSSKNGITQISFSYSKDYTYLKVKESPEEIIELMKHCIKFVNGCVIHDIN